MWGQFSVKDISQKTLYQNKDKKQILKYRITNNYDQSLFINPKNKITKNEYCTVMNPVQQDLKPGQSIEVTANCDFSKYPYDKGTLNFPMPLRLSSETELVFLPISTSLYSSKKAPLNKDTCNNPYRAKCKNTPQKMNTLCFLAPDSFFISKRNMSYLDCDKDAIQLRARSIDEIKDHLKSYYDDTCGLIKKIQFINPKTLVEDINDLSELEKLQNAFKKSSLQEPNPIGEHKRKKADVIYEGPELSCLLSQNFKFDLKGSDLNTSCRSHLYTYALSDKLFKGLLPNKEISALKTCQKECLLRTANFKKPGHQICKNPLKTQPLQDITDHLNDSIWTTCAEATAIETLKELNIYNLLETPSNQ